VAKFRAPSSLWKQDDIFEWSFSMRTSRSAKLLVMGTRRSVAKRVASGLTFLSAATRLNDLRSRLRGAGLADRLNPVLRGWGAYFRHGNSSDKFTTIDSYVNQRLAQLASHKHGLRGWNWTTRFNYRWANSLDIYRLSGTVVYEPAHA